MNSFPRNPTVISRIISVLILSAVSVSGYGQSGPGLDSILPGTKEVKAIIEAYPEQIEGVRIDGMDWGIKIGGSWHYWADGRFLPESLRTESSDYVAIRFYNYYFGPAVYEKPDEELTARLKNYTAERNRDPRLRDNSFLDSLYGIKTRSQAENIMKTITFLGKKLRVHPLLTGPLAEVEELITEAAETDAEVRAYLDNLHQIHGYSWRNIAGTARRSYHSYGVAVDMIPSSYDFPAYWQWAANGGDSEWWGIPPERRHQVPLKIIEAFEAGGFIWGGKWLLFDNIHFEYRPEIILMSRK